VDVGGVGYLVFVSSHTARELPLVGEPVALRTRQIVREDSNTLFGFSEVEELKLFDLLITVSGVGPRLAMAVLSGLKPGALGRAIKDENVGALVAIPGVGRKTAERLVVELRDKLEVIAVASGTPAKPSGVLPKSERFDDAVAALTSLGYTASQAREAIQNVADHADALTLEELVRRSLARLGKQTANAR
jgi:Holliday junction DNA helicase RuvA